jgi:hypothetical protein
MMKFFVYLNSGYIVGIVSLSPTCYRLMITPIFFLLLELFNCKHFSPLLAEERLASFTSGVICIADLDIEQTLGLRFHKLSAVYKWAGDLILSVTETTSKTRP